MENILFNIPAEKFAKGLTCLSCEHRERHQCGGSVIQYCAKIKSNRTENGQLKIKCKTPACIHHQPIKQ